jgi:hypothetical protein
MSSPSFFSLSFRSRRARRGQLDHHPIVAHGHLETELRQLLQLAAQEVEALADLVELLGAAPVLFQGLVLRPASRSGSRC